MSDIIVKPKVLTLEQLALREISKTVWNILVSQHLEEKFVSTNCTIKSRINIYDSTYLQDYRSRVLKVLQEVLPTGFSKLLKHKIVGAAIALRLGYIEAFDWILCYGKKFIQDNVKYSFKIFEEKFRNLLYSATFPYVGKYDASRFINSLGHFEDLLWVKLFVADENQPLNFRFYLACYYCLEEEVDNLWRTAKANNQSVWDCYDADMTLKCGNLMKMWIDHLEHGSHAISTYRIVRFREIISIVNQWETSPSDREVSLYHVQDETGTIIEQDYFFINGVSEAVDGHFEHAVKFFFTPYSIDETHHMLSEMYVNDDILSSAARENCAGFVYFIYSALSRMTKIEILQSATSDQRYIWVLVCMLSSNYYYESIASDILTFRDAFPLKFYLCILDKLAYLIKNCSILLHKKVFKMLWNHLSRDERSEVLSSSKILESLSDDIDDFDLLETIILPLPRSMKEELLLNDFQKAFRARLKWFFNTDDNEGFLRYLLFFFLDFDASSEKLTLTADAANLLDRLMNSKRVKRITVVFFTSEARKFNKVIKQFKGILPVLVEEVNQMDRGVSIHDFLSRKIYPLFSEEGN